MNGIIIAGGFGTRLRPLTYGRPKHLLPVANRPFLEYQIDWLRRYGVTDVVLATNYCADQIEAHFGDGLAFGVTMRYSLEEEPLGTAGAIRQAAGLVAPGPALVLNGDVLADFDLGALLTFHRAVGSIGTIALRPISRPHPFGALEIGAGGRVRRWVEPSEEEKRRLAESPPEPTGETDFINAGIYVLEEQTIARIPTGRFVSIERETYPELLDAEAPIHGLSLEGFWLDMGRPEQYLAATRAVLGNVVFTEVRFERVAPTASVAPDAAVDALSSLGRGVRIGEAARITMSILQDYVTIGARTVIEGAIVEEGVTIGEDVRISPGTVLPRGTVIGRGARL